MQDLKLMPPSVHVSCKDERLCVVFFIKYILKHITLFVKDELFLVNLLP